MTKPAHPPCYVCRRPVAPVSMQEQLAAHRAMNVPIHLGPNLVRHSYCAPGSDRWLSSMSDGRTLTYRDRFWLRIFTPIPEA